MTPQDALHKLTAGQDLTREEARTVMDTLMQGQATPAQIGALLIALRMKGESVAEVAGFAEGMRAHALPVRPKRTPLLDTCGTGGSAFRVFNVSTAAAFVAAAADIPVAKHGNRAMTGVCGSADVLEALGVRVTLTPEQCAACVDTVGVGFLFAQAHHPAMKHVGPMRREIGVRTVFNLLGPLSNPAGAARQVMGVYADRLCPLACGALQELGSERALTLHAAIGLDEMATFGETRVCELRDGTLSEYTLTPADLGLHGPEPTPEILAPAATPEANAALLRDILTPDRNDIATRTRRELVAVNAAASLRLFDRAETWPDAVRLAHDLILSGKPLAVLENLAALTTTF